MTLALLFPGQGVQHAGMLPWLEAEPLAGPVLSALEKYVGDDWRARLADDDWASSNQVAQPLMTGVSLAAWAALAPHLRQPAVVAGYSVGELAACSAAGVFDADTALRLSRQRAAFMDQGARGEPGGLMSVSRLAMKEVSTIGARFDLAVAIRIGVDRCVIGGPLGALEACASELRARGAELALLRVRLASHTPAMASGAGEFSTLIENMTWSRSNCLIVCDLDGAGRREPASLKQALARQIDHTVEWGRCMETVAERRPGCVLEVGPASTLARMWAALYPEVPVRSVDEFQSAEAVVDWVQQALG